MAVARSSARRAASIVFSGISELGAYGRSTCNPETSTFARWLLLFCSPRAIASSIFPSMRYSATAGANARDCLRAWRYVTHRSIMTLIEPDRQGAVTLVQVLFGDVAPVKPLAGLLPVPGLEDYGLVRFLLWGFVSVGRAEVRCGFALRRVQTALPGLCLAG